MYYSRLSRYESLIQFLIKNITNYSSQSHQGCVCLVFIWHYATALGALGSDSKALKYIGCEQSEGSASAGMFGR